MRWFTAIQKCFTVSNEKLSSTVNLLSHREEFLKETSGNVGNGNASSGNAGTERILTGTGNASTGNASTGNVGTGRDSNLLWKHWLC